MPILVYLFFFKRNEFKQVWVFILYIAISFTSDNLILYFSKTNNEAGTFLSLSLFTLLEFSLFAIFLISIIKRPLLKTIIKISIFLFTILSALTYFIFRQEAFDSLNTTIESILIISFCIFFLFEELNNVEVVFIYQKANFWFVFGMLVYLAGNFFLFIQADEFSKEIRDGFWSINLFSNILKNCLFAIAFFLPKDHKSNSLYQY